MLVAGTVGIAGRLWAQHLYQEAGGPCDAEALRVVGGLRSSGSPQLLNGKPEQAGYTGEVNCLPPPR